MSIAGAGAGPGGRAAKGAARIFRIDGPGVDAVNLPGKPETVTLRELEPAGWTGSLALDLPACSVTLVRVEGAEG